jgi:hypothetical protein
LYYEVLWREETWDGSRNHSGLSHGHTTVWTGDRFGNNQASSLRKLDTLSVGTNLRPWELSQVVESPATPVPLYYGTYMVKNTFFGNSAFNFRHGPLTSNARSHQQIMEDLTGASA